jgi:hypothetical protein
MISSKEEKAGRLELDLRGIANFWVQAHVCGEERQR